MGRRTYEVFSESWPKITDDIGMADRMNALPKFCGDTEPTDLISHHATEVTFRLADVRRYDSGVIILHYQPA